MGSVKVILDSMLSSSEIWNKPGGVWYCIGDISINSSVTTVDNEDGKVVISEFNAVEVEDEVIGVE